MNTHPLVQTFAESFCRSWPQLLVESAVGGGKSFGFHTKPRQSHLCVCVCAEGEGRGVVAWGVCGVMWVSVMSVCA